MRRSLEGNGKRDNPEAKQTAAEPAPERIVKRFECCAARQSGRNGESAVSGSRGGKCDTVACPIRKPFQPPSKPIPILLDATRYVEQNITIHTLSHFAKRGGTKQ